MNLMNLTNYTAILAENATAGGGSTWYMIIMIVVLFAAMYFFGIRPQRKQEKEATAMRNGLQVGDEITTIGGIIGKIVSIKGETCMIETGRDRTKIRILKSAIKTVDVPASVANGAVPVDTAAKKEIAAPEQSENVEEKAEGAEEDNKSKKKKASKK